MKSYVRCPLTQFLNAQKLPVDAQVVINLKLQSTRWQKFCAKLGFKYKTYTTKITIDPDKMEILYDQPYGKIIVENIQINTINL